MTFKISKIYSNTELNCRAQGHLTRVLKPNTQNDVSSVPKSFRELLKVYLLKLTRLV